MKIQPSNYVQLPLDGIATDLNIVVNSFSLFPASIEVSWTISGGGFSKGGTLTLPYSIIQSWGTDDTVVKNYVLQELNLIEAPDGPAPQDNSQQGSTEI